MAKNAIYKALLNIFNLIVPIFTNIHVFGLISASDMGIYSSAYVDLQFFVGIASFGVYNYAVRELTKLRHKPEERNQLYTSFFVIILSTNLIALIVYYLYFMQFASGLAFSVYTILSIQLIANIVYVEFLNESIENYRFIMIKTMLIRILYLVAIFTLVRKESDILWYTLVVTLTIFFNNLASFLYTKKFVRFDFSKIRIKMHLIPLLVSAILANGDLLYINFDAKLIGDFISKEYVTVYWQVFTLTGMIAMVPTALVSVSLPRLSYYIGENKLAEYEQTVNKMIVQLLSLIIPISLGIFVLSYETLFIYTQGKYAYGYHLLQISALGRLVYIYQSVLTYSIMYASGYEKQLMIFSIGFGLLNIIKNYILLFLGLFNPINVLIGTIFIILLYTLSMKKFVESKIDITIDFYSKKIIPYLMGGLSFIPITELIKLFNLSLYIHTLSVIAVCGIIYIAIMYWQKNQVLMMILRKVGLVKC